MRISVIMPTFNRAQIIGRSIESVLAQTYPDVELIVIDDGSTDNTEEIISGYARKTVRPIVYRRKGNGGCASARNLGLRIATGDLVAPLDSDDTWAPDALANLAASLGDAGFVYSPAIEVFEDGSEEINYPVASSHPQAFAVEHFLSTNVRNGAVLYRRLAVEAAGGYDESLRYNEDSDTLQRVAILYEAAYCPAPTVYHRHHAGSKSNNRVEIYRALLRSSEAILEKYQQFSEKLGERAEIRINDIKKELLIACIESEYFEDAAKLSSEVSDIGRTGVYYALLFKSKIPIVVENKILQLVRCLRKYLIKPCKKLN